MPATARTASRSPSPPAHRHGQAPFTAVLLCNLGTPDEPTPAAVRRYLAEFLSDRRVVEIPRAAWLPILYGLILPLRSAKSAAKYRTIWTPEGSPLKVWTERQARRLQGWLGERGHHVRVAYAMCHGAPSIAGELDALADAGANRILVTRLSAHHAIRIFRRERADRWRRSTTPVGDRILKGRIESSTESAEQGATGRRPSRLGALPAG